MLFFLLVVGLCWGVTMFAPFALLAELILVDSTPPSDSYALRNQSTSSFRRPRSGPSSHHSSRSELHVLGHDDDDDGWHEAQGLMANKSSLEQLPMLPPSPPPSPPSSRSSESDDGRHKVEIRYSNNLSDPRVSQTNVDEVDSAGLDLVEEDLAVEEVAVKKSGGGTAEKAGVILGIHNVFIVVPQFLITFLSSIIFFLLDPARTVVHAPVPPAIVHNSTTTLALENALNGTAAFLDARQEGGGGPAGAANTEAVGFIFRFVPFSRLPLSGRGVANMLVSCLPHRFGGVSAIIACYLTWSMMRSKWNQGLSI